MGGYPGSLPDPTPRPRRAAIRRLRGVTAEHSNGGLPDLRGRLALRPREAAAALGLSDRTLRKWMREEGLPYLRVGGVVLIPRGQLEEWMVGRVEWEGRSDALASEILDGI